MRLLPVLVSCIYVTSVFGRTYVGPKGGYAVFPVEKDAATTSRTTTRSSTPTPNNNNNRNTGTRNEFTIRNGEQQQQSESTNRDKINRDILFDCLKYLLGQLNNRRNNQDQGFNNDRTTKNEDDSNPTPNNNRNTGTRNEFTIRNGDQQQQTKSTNRDNINRDILLDLLKYLLDQLNNKRNNQDQGFNNDTTTTTEDDSNPIFENCVDFADDGDEFHTDDGEANLPENLPHYVRRYPSWGDI